MKSIIPIAIGLALICCSCVNDNEADLFPHAVVTDSVIKGQLAWFDFDSTLKDRLGNIDPLKFWGDLERGRDHRGEKDKALVLDGIHDYLSGFIGNYDTLAISLWFLPMPNYQKSYLFDYGVGQFSAGLDAITAATMPSFRMFLQQDTTIWYWANELSYFNWHHLYMEIGNAAHSPRLFIDGSEQDTLPKPWKMRPLTDLLYIGRPCRADIIDTLLYRGHIDDIRIYNTFLSDEEIYNLFWGD